MNLRKTILVIACVFFTLGLALGEGSDKTLKFNANGEFRIVQITDTHFKWGKSASNVVIELINEVLETERPDLVVFTGDNVYADSVEQALRVQLDPIEKRGVPFIVLFGNHDHQFDIDQNAQWDIFRSCSWNVQPDRPEGRKYEDFALPVLSSDGSKVAQVIYNFDSHDGRKIDKNISHYDWLEFDQIGWYRDRSRQYTEANGGTPVPSIMFLHIPLPEYSYALDARRNGSKKKTGIPGVVGTVGEDVCSPKLNSGMFTSMIECGDVRAVFCGHDHDNDFATTWKNIFLAYGRYSGGNTVYNHIGKNGVRVIVLNENNNNIQSYIRLRGGEIIDRCTFPTDFKRD